MLWDTRSLETGGDEGIALTSAAVTSVSLKLAKRNMQSESSLAPW